MAEKKKFYVVFEGVEPGIYKDWKEAEKQISGYPKAKQKSYINKVDAEKAFQAHNLTKQFRPVSVKVSNDVYRSNQPQVLQSESTVARTIQSDIKSKDKGDNWAQFWFCLIYHMLVPMAPLIIEFAYTSHIRLETLSVTGFLYGIGIGVHSRSLSQFSFYTIFSIVMCIIFTHSITERLYLKTEAQSEVGMLICTMLIFIIFSIHLVERVKRHIILGEPFLHFKISI